MKKLIMLFLCAASMLRADTAVTNAWDVDVLAPVPFVTDIWRGETIALTARTGISNIAETAEFLWQTNGMSSSWWSTNATVTASGEVTALWTPAMDTGASVYSFFFKVGGIYRPFGTIKMKGSPGTYPNEVALPVRSIDFATVTVLNPPWATPADVAAATNGIPAPDFSPYLRRDGYNETVYGWSLKMKGTDSNYNYGELRQIGLDVSSASSVFSSYRAGKILVAPGVWVPPRTIVLPYADGTMALISDITAATNSEAIARSAGDAVVSNYVESIRGVFQDLATNVVYHVVVSNGHWLIQEVQ